MRSAALAVLEAVADHRPSTPARGANVGGVERAGTAITGVALLALAMRRPSLATTMAGVVGGALVYRAARGRSRVYEALGVSTARPGRVERVVTVNRLPDDLHRGWQDRAVRGRVMQGVAELDVITDAAEEMMSWRANDRGPAGHITFRRASGGRGTEVRLALEDASAAEADEILRRFKQLMESGEIATAAVRP